MFLQEIISFHILEEQIIFADTSNCKQTTQ